MSPIIATLILIALVVVMAAVIAWAAMQSVPSQGLHDTAMLVMKAP